MEEQRLTIDQVRQMVAVNSVIDDQGSLDPEFVAMLDHSIDFDVFISGGNIWSREELMSRYPFAELKVAPENVFAAQEIGIFPARGTAFANEGLEYLARDAGDDSVSFVMLEDMVGAACRGAAHVARRAPLRTLVTKIYVGREAWEDFQLVARLCRAVARTPALAIALAQTEPRLAIEAEREADLQRRESALDSFAEREADLRRREAALAAQQELVAAQQELVDADLARLQAAFRASAGPTAAK